jgi:hypothetical protein
VKLSLMKIRSDMEQIMPRSVYWIFLITAFIVFGTVLFKIFIINTDSRITQSIEKAFPRQAMQWIQTNSPEGYMMNSYNWGGFFDWYLRDYPVFIDSRADLFGDEIIGQWLVVMNAREGWQEILTRWNVNFIVTEPGWRIVDILPFYGWEELYRDDQAVIFGRTQNISTQN